MPTVTVSGKHQITLPMDIVRALQIQPGGKLVVDLIEDRIVAMPEPASWARHYLGSARGIYGGTKQRVDRYVAEERASWASDGGSDFEDFADFYLRSEGTPGHRLIAALSHRSWADAPTAEQLVQETHLPAGQVEELMESDLGTRGWVRRTDDSSGKPRYRLRRDLADALKAA